MAKSKIEPFWWSLFSAGGMIAAMLFPVLMVIIGIAVPLGLGSDGALSYERVSGALARPILRLIVFVLIALPLFHWAHRFLFTLVDVGLQQLRTALSILCYGTAVVGTVITAWTLLRI